MRRAGIGLAALLFALAAHGAEQPPEEALAAALRLEKEGAFHKALAVYESFLKTYPDHVQALNATYRLGQCYDSVGQPEKAVAVYEKVLAAGQNRNFRHRADTIVALAKLYGEAKRYEDGTRVLQVLLKEGAGVYEDEAQNLCAGYLALMEKFEESALLFNLLRQKPESSLAKEAAYKVAIVWMKAGKIDLARAAVEEFVQRYPGHPRALELMVRVAQEFFNAKQYKSAASVCSQVLSQYRNAAEAIEAAFIIALCHRENGTHEKAVEAFEALARMPQAEQNTVIASESLFEAAQICRKHLNREEDAIEFFRRAAHKARDPATDRQKLILEHSLFNVAEYHFKKEEWSAALDLYLQLRKVGTQINLLSRILHCQSKMDKYGAASISMESEEERKFVEERIASNPGTLIALQGEVFLLDKRLEKVLLSGRPLWAALEEVLDGFGKLLARYKPEVLAQQQMTAYIRMRMAGVYASAPEDSERKEPDPELKPRWQKGLALYEEALREAPDSLYRVEMLEGIATLAYRLGESRKAFDAYRRLYEITGREPPQAPPDGASASSARRDPLEYLRGLAAVADGDDLVEQAIATVNEVIVSKPQESREGREARFYLGELYFMKKRYSDAADAYRRFIRAYGPPMDLADNVLEGWVKPKQVDEVLDKVYEAGIRIAHCWYAQGHRVKMRQAYEWVVKYQDHLNPRIAEAAYATIVHARKPDAKGEESADSRAAMAEALWKQVVNPSMDFGSKQFTEGFHFWIRNPVAVPFVRNAILKAGDLYGKAGRHAVAAEMFKQYLELFGPDGKTKGRRGNADFVADDEFQIASYAVGREYIQVGDFESMAKFYRPYVDGFRDGKFRTSILLLLGHYGTEGELYDDAREAYAALLDEYGEPNPADRNGYPIPVPKDKRLRPGSSWNGLRMKPPQDWDPGKIRFSLGFLFWKKEDWAGCKAALTPFRADPALAANKSRDQALFMLGRALMNLKEYAESAAVLAALIREYPSFKAVEEAYVDACRAAAEARDWKAVDGHFAGFVAKHADSVRRPYMDLYRAVAFVGKGQVEEGSALFRSLSRADTYADVKAEAFYHLGTEALVGSRPDTGRARELFEKSVDLYPQARSLLAAGRCAVVLQDWAAARKYLERCRLEFPRSDPALQEEARRLLEKVAVGEATRR